MAVAFAREGHNASAMCTDVAFSYFLITGSLTPTPVGANRTPLSSLLTLTPVLDDDGSPHQAPGVKVTAESPSRAHLMSARSKLGENGEAVVTGEQDIQGNQTGESSSHSDACGAERSPELTTRACDTWADSPCDNGASCGTSGSVWSPVAALDKGGDRVEEDGSNVESKSLFSARTKTLPETPPSTQETDASTAQSPSDAGEMRLLTPGQSLDFYLRRRSTSFSSQDKKTTDLKGGFVESIGGGAAPISAGDSSSGMMAGTAWRLVAREATCIGRVSRRLLHELEREEEKHEVEEKVAFLRKTEVGKSPSLRRGAPRR